MPEFDYIISGAGAAGLSLAYHLARAGLTGKRILLIDRTPKRANDRTWCFWEIGISEFEKLVYRRWERVAVYGEQFAAAFNLAPYAYKMLRSGDFYQFMETWISQQPNITRCYEEVIGVGTENGYGYVRTRNHRYQAEWVFNSILLDPLRPSPLRHYLVQHFLGWVIRAPSVVFDPHQATLMDFRVPQARRSAQFVYVLPFDPYTALVEYTIFSAELLPREAYVTALRGYLTQQLRLESFTVEHEEFGTIPMTDAPFPPSAGRVIHLGIAGGDAKPSTGYTFQRVQRRVAHIASALRNGDSPLPCSSWRRRRHSLYDSVLLNVIALGRRRGDQVFCELFARNPVQRVLRFLDEDTSISEELSLMSTTHIPTFVMATADVLVRRVQAKLTHA